MCTDCSCAVPITTRVLEYRFELLDGRWQGRIGEFQPAIAPGVDALEVGLFGDHAPPLRADVDGFALGQCCSDGC